MSHESMLTTGANAARWAEAATLWIDLHDIAPPTEPGREPGEGDLEDHGQDGPARAGASRLTRRPDEPNHHQPAGDGECARTKAHERAR